MKPIFYGTVTDVEGNVYKIVTIGSQTWMKENLKTTKFNNGDPIPLVKDPFDWGTLKTAAYCWYNNDSSYKRTYGALYNFYTIDSSNICPTGWHVPDFEEWSALASYLGLIVDVGSKIKENDTEHWAYPNAGATNESGFTGLPGGERGQYATTSGGKRPEDATFYSLKIRGYWWTSFEENKTNAYYFYVEQNSNAILREHPIKSFGASVRCIKD